MAEVVRSNAGKPTSEVFDVAAWALSALDYNLADQCVGDVVARNGKPRSARYFVVALTEQAAVAGVTMPSYAKGGAAR